MSTLTTINPSTNMLVLLSCTVDLCTCISKITYQTNK